MVEVLARNMEYTPVTHMSNLERDERVDEENLSNLT